MRVQPITFKNLQLNMQNGVSSPVVFNYQNYEYSFSVLEMPQGLYIIQSTMRANKVAVNQILAGTAIDLLFYKDDFGYDNDLSLNTLFSKYQLGVIKYED